MTTLNLNCACDPCVTSYYRISTESHDCCNLIGSANIPAEPTETCSESADPLSLVPFSSSPCISLVPSKARSEGLPRPGRLAGCTASYMCARVWRAQRVHATHPLVQGNTGKEGMTSCSVSSCLDIEQGR